ASWSSASPRPPNPTSSRAKSKPCCDDRGPRVSAAPGQSVVLQAVRCLAGGDPGLQADARYAGPDLPAVPGHAGVVGVAGCRACAAHAQGVGPAPAAGFRHADAAAQASAATGSGAPAACRAGRASRAPGLERGGAVAAAAGRCAEGPPAVPV